MKIATKKQDIFDIVADHLLTQMEQSISDDDNYAYRGENGLKCAIGGLIPDDYYKPEMEGKSVTEIMSGPFVGWRAHCSILSCLQDVHDYWRPEYWAVELVELAERYDIDPKIAERALE